MNAFIAAILRLGIISATDAQALDAATLTPEDAQALAEARMQEAFRTGLLAQSERLFKLLGGNANPSAAQWAAFWEQENAALLASVQPAITATAQQSAVFASVKLAGDGWRTVNEAVIRWTNEYYTSATEFGSVENLNQTARQQVAKVFEQWQRGEFDHALGLPSLAIELEPTFGVNRAKEIAITETTRIYSEAERQTAIADPDVVYLRWLSAADELVCSICGPLHGRMVGKRENGITHPGGLYTGFPPAHPRCRCRIVEETELTAKVPLRDSFNPNAPRGPGYTQVKMING